MHQIFVVIIDEYVIWENKSARTLLLILLVFFSRSDSACVCLSAELLCSNYCTQTMFKQIATGFMHTMNEKKKRTHTHTVKRLIDKIPFKFCMEQVAKSRCQCKSYEITIISEAFFFSFRIFFTFVYLSLMTGSIAQNLQAQMSKLQRLYNEIPRKCAWCSAFRDENQERNRERDRKKTEGEKMRALGKTSIRSWSVTNLISE